MEPKKQKFTSWLKTSITARMIVVGFLLFVLLIPLEFVKTLITERAYRQQEVIQEINGKWGNEVLLSGPILKIPYKTYREEKVYIPETKVFEIKTEEIINNAYLFPDDLNIVSKVTTKEEPLKRSIYESVVFTSEIAVDGSFPSIDFSSKDIPHKDIIWDKISVLIKTSNLKGIRNTIEVNLAGETLAMTPKYSQAYLNTIETQSVSNFPKESTEMIPFSFTMKVNGSESLKFIPIGKETDVSMTSNWHSPSFDGNFLPDDGSREITKDGFKSTWKVLQINRQFQQEFFNELPDLTEFAFGSKLIIPIDEYQKSERTAKYGFMVIGLTLLVFLLIQLVSKIYIHPFQYIMIGLALVMFYTLLISISEHSSFFKAYVIASASVLGLITLYSRAILKGFKFPLLICGSLASLYGFIYVIIQLEKYALLVGSIGLFIILAIIMFASRKIDWGNE
ncbi:cell envelope integrity protein CreD [Aureisphaera sp. CAU 1614]|uniref:Cell envelope integrity protein CreD n=1 Tax=Halomarinibacterium sedimenti TaxID=2857106 RepID=A0A9X1FQH4_9FLAO|nr:cell envelope integrity protein CreD [Halomarinibacterium sedimenti]MBW2938923.1 cell envelope integrity protein CreD [Halomarinibacterium sedimenti]